MSTNNAALNDELEALNSIYGPEILTVSQTTDDVVIAILSLPNAPFSFNLTLPPDYPDTPPSVNGTHHVGQYTKKGEGDHAVHVLRDVLGRTYIPSQVCLFDLIEEASPLLLRGDKGETDQLHRDNAGFQDESDNVDTTNSSAAPIENIAIKTPNLTDVPQHPLPASPPIPPPNWFLSETLVVNKSTFVGRSLRVASLQEAKDSLSHLIAHNKKVASATHNITAWRIKQQRPAGSSSSTSAREIVIQDCDDDGETAAGGRLLHLMQLMDVWNCVVVVTRWYGGVKLGTDRFRCINAVAREALVTGGFVKDATTASGKNTDGGAGGKSGTKTGKGGKKR